MGLSPLGRQVCLSCVSVTLQALVAVSFFLVSLYAASILVQPLELVGITQIPPGIRYVDLYAERQSRH